MCVYEYAFNSQMEAGFVRKTGTIGRRVIVIPELGARRDPGQMGFTVVTEVRKKHTHTHTQPKSLVSKFLIKDSSRGRGIGI